jgi:hypothetical protein
MRAKGLDCCSHLNGLEVKHFCDNCHAMVVESQRLPGEIQVIDSVKAKKALQCVKEIAAIDDEWWPGDIDEEGVLQIHKLLVKYGFVKGREWE